MPASEPKITIGVPVRNGERFLRRALDSIRSQTFDDFEVVISDNASDDATQEICRDYVARDPRFRYFRNPANMGAAANFNRTFELARGRFFKWAGHDDWIDPDYLHRCLELFDRHSEAILCFSAQAWVDDDGRVTKLGPDRPKIHRLDSSDPRVRFHTMLWYLKDTHPVFGLMRTDSLRKTGLIQNAPEPDRILLGELSLVGAMLRIPDPLLYRALSPRGRDKWKWLNPSNRGWSRLATVRMVFHHLAALTRSRLGALSKILLAIDVLIAFAVRRTSWRVRRARRLRRRQGAREHTLDLKRRSCPQGVAGHETVPRPR